MSPLAALRGEIDGIDAELAALLKKRFAIADRVIQVKKIHDLPAALPDRVEQVVKNAQQHFSGSNVSPQAIENIWRTLIAETIAYEDQVLSKK